MLMPCHQKPTLFGRFLLGERARDGPQRKSSLPGQRYGAVSAGRLLYLSGVVVQVGVGTEEREKE